MVPGLAAMLVSVAVGALRNEKSDLPAVILAALNEALVGHTGGGFVTCCCARFDVQFDADGRVALANAGHLAPYLEGGVGGSVPSTGIPGFPLNLKQTIHLPTEQLADSPLNRAFHDATNMSFSGHAHERFARALSLICLVYRMGISITA